MLKFKSFNFNPFQTCCSVIWDDNSKNEASKENKIPGIIIDPSFYTENERNELFSFIENKGIEPQKILLTHAHFDHIFGVCECINQYNIPVYMHPADKITLNHNEAFAKLFRLKVPNMNFETVDIHQGDKIRINDNANEVEFEVIETPGHTPGGVCYYDKMNKILFSGDTLFAGSIGRTDSVIGDYDKLIVSIMDKIMGIDGETFVVPGHGPTTSISQERTHNPFLEPFNEPLEENPYYKPEEEE